MIRNNPGGIANVTDVKYVKQEVRLAISEAEAAAAKLTEYLHILEQLNGSNFDVPDMQNAVNQLEHTSLSQKDLHTFK